MTTSGADKSIDQAAPSWPQAAAPVRRPLGAIYWLCIGWLGLVVVAGVLVLLGIVGRGKPDEADD